MHGASVETIILKAKSLFLVLFAGTIIFANTGVAWSDIYRFVTVDGVESFTDAPVNKEARVVIRETSKKSHRSGEKQNTVLSRRIHNISLDEVVEKTVSSSLNPQGASNNTFIEPKLPPVGGTITSGVGMRIDPIDGKWRHHNGIDIAIPEGTPVMTAAAGVVVFSGHRPGYGNTVLIEHNNGMITLYAHNSQLMVAQDQQVDSNTVIALSGNTGRSTGPHLHFEAWQAGVNVTPAFLPDTTMQLPKIQLAANKSKDRFRKEIMTDGTILFTNIPASIP